MWGCLPRGGGSLTCPHCVTGCAGRWLPGLAAGPGPAGWAGTNTSGAPLVLVSAPPGWVERARQAAGWDRQPAPALHLPGLPAGALGPLGEGSSDSGFPWQGGAPGLLQADPGGHTGGPALPQQQPGHREVGVLPRTGGRHKRVRLRPLSSLSLSDCHPNVSYNAPRHRPLSGAPPSQPCWNREGTLPCPSSPPCQVMAHSCPPPSPFTSGARGPLGTWPLQVPRWPSCPRKGPPSCQTPSEGADCSYCPRPQSRTLGESLHRAGCLVPWSCRDLQPPPPTPSGS